MVLVVCKIFDDLRNCGFCYKTPLLFLYILNRPFSTLNYHKTLYIHFKQAAQDMKYLLTSYLIIAFRLDLRMF